MRLLKYVNKVVCEKGNIAGRGRGCRQNLYRGKKTSENAGGKPTCGFSIQHNTFSALNYAQDFGTTVQESLKRTTRSKRVTLEIKVELSRVKYFHAFVSTLRLCPPIGANSDWIHQLNSKNNGSVCYLRLYFGIDNISRRLLQWIARIKNGLNLRPTKRYRTYSNQISTRLIPIR